MEKKRMTTVVYTQNKNLFTKMVSADFCRVIVWTGGAKKPLEIVGAAKRYNDVIYVKGELPEKEDRVAIMRHYKINEEAVKRINVELYARPYEITRLLYDIRTSKELTEIERKKHKNTGFYNPRPQVVVEKMNEFQKMCTGYELKTEQMTVKVKNLALIGLESGASGRPYIASTMGEKKATGPDKVQMKFLRDEQLAAPLYDQTRRHMEGKMNLFQKKQFKEARMVMLPKSDERFRAI